MAPVGYPVGSRMREPAARRFAEGNMHWNALDVMQDPSVDDPPRGVAAYHLTAREHFWRGMWGPMPPVDQSSDPCGGLSLPPVLPDGLASVPLPLLERHRKMSRRYRARTSVGLDWIHPRRRAWLSDESVLSLFKLWAAILRLGRLLIILARSVVNLLQAWWGRARRRV
eukprot:8690588-Pyramimonas_sp.AAC.1